MSVTRRTFAAVTRPARFQAVTVKAARARGTYASFHVLEQGSGAREAALRMRNSFVVLVVVAAACSTEPPQNLDTGDIVAEHEALDFGAVFVGESRVLPLRIQNRGRITGPLQLRVVGPFRVTGAPQAALAPGEVGEVLVSFAPEGTGPATGELDAAIEGVGSAIVVRLAGEGTRPEIEVTDRVDFGPIELGTTGSRPILVRNLSEKALIVTATIDGAESHAFELSTDHLRIPATSTSELDIEFTPGVDDVHSAILHLACAGCSRHDIVVTGSGSVQDVQIAPEQVDFGFVPVGSGSRLEILLTNLGATPAWVASATLRAPRGSPFTLEAPPLPAPLASSRIVLPLIFRPAAATSYQAEVRIEVAGQVFEIPIDGRGGDEGLRAEPAILDFGLLPAGEPATRRVRFHDTGTAGASVQEVRIDDDARGRFKATPARGLPASARDEPLDVDVTFSSGSVDRFDATLVFLLSGGRERTVPIRARTVAGGYCDLRVDAALPLGLATVGRFAERVLRIRNPASVDCTLGPFEITGSPSFSLPGFAAGELHFLEARGTLAVPVRFTPSRTGFVPETASLVFGQVHDKTTSRSVELSGLGTDLDLRFDPPEILFATALQGSEQLVALGVINDGPLPVRLEDQVLSPVLPALSLHAPAAAILPSGERGTLHVRFAPLDAEVTSAELHLRPEGSVASFIVPVSGDARATPCGAACAAPVVSCPVIGETFLQRELRLAGAAADPGGTLPSCTWTVSAAPPGSIAEVTPSGPCAATFRPDVDGRYELELAATDPQGNTGRCTTTTDAVPYPGLWVEARLAVADEIDVHLFRGGDPGDPAAWGGPSDCWELVPRRDWGEPGLAGDPVLDPGAVTEVIRIEQPAPGQDLELGVHWPTARHGHASLDVETAVWCGGIEVDRRTTALGEPYQAAHVGTVHVLEGDSCTFTPSTTRTEVLP